MNFLNSLRRDDQGSDFAPPPGPPPGWQSNHRPTHSHSSGYAPPPQPPRPSADYNHGGGYGNYGGYQSNQNSYGPPNGGPSQGGYYGGGPPPQQSYGGSRPPNYQQPPPPQQYLQPQKQNEGSHSRPTSPNSMMNNISQTGVLPTTKFPGTMYPREMYMWWTTDENLGTFIKMGPEIRGEALFVAKLFMSKSKIALRPGSSFNKEKREDLAVAEGSALSGGSYKIVQLAGQSVKIPIEKKIEDAPGMRGTWQWHTSDNLMSSITNRLSGKAKSYHFSDQEEGGTIVAKFNGELDLTGATGASTKKVLGHFTFCDPIGMSNRPQEFATVVLMAFLRVQHKVAEKQMVKSAFKGGMGG